MTERGTIDTMRDVLADGRRPLLLVRHGRTAANAQRVLVGRRDVPLDEEGAHQAEALRARLVALGPSLYLTSPLARARQTLAGLAPVEVVGALVEVAHGDLEGLPEVRLGTDYAEFLARWKAAPGRTRIPGGESVADAVDRALPALQARLDAHPAPALLVVCSHQLVLAGLCCALLREPLAGWTSHRNHNTGVTLLSEGADGWRIELQDDLSHLEEG